MQKKFLLILIFSLILLSGLASAKSFSLDSANVEFVINPNGSVSVTEFITFNFSGSFTYAYRDLPIGSWEYQDFKVFDETEELRFDTSNNGNTVRYKWYYSATNEIKTFKMTYTILGAVNKYSDVGEFYWKVWQEGWDRKLGELNGFILFPSPVKDANEIYSWGHPQINGKIGVLDNQKLIFQAFNIPSYQWVEIRTAFPSSMLTMPLTSNTPELQRIITDENNYVVPTSFSDEFMPFEDLLIFGSTLFMFGLIFIIVIAMVITQSFAPNLATKLSLVVTIIVMMVFFLPFILLMGINYWLILPAILVQLIIFVACWHFFGREPIVRYKNIYERVAPSDLQPALVKLLLDSLIKTPATTEIGPEILYLAIKKKLQIERVMVKDKEEFLIKIINKDSSNLSHSQKILFELLDRIAREDPQSFWDKYIFRKKIDSTPDIVSIKDIQNYLTENPTEAQVWLKSWQDAIKKEYKSHKFEEKKME